MIHTAYIYLKVKWMRFIKYLIQYRDKEGEEGNDGEGKCEMRAGAEAEIYKL